MRSSVPSAATTSNVGAVRLSASEARSRMQAGSGVATLPKKLETRRSDMVVGLMPAGGGMDKPSPDRAWFAQGAAGDEAHNKELRVLTIKLFHSAPEGPKEPKSFKESGGP